MNELENTRVGGDGQPMGETGIDGDASSSQMRKHGSPQLADDPPVSTGAPEGDNAARAVTSLFTEGVASMKEMSAARRAHSKARGELGQLEDAIAEREEELGHRRDVETRYAQIVAEQTARKNKAEQERAGAEKRRAHIDAEMEKLKEELDEMRAEDATAERRLKSALEAAEDKERAARESGRRLQRRLDDAKAHLDRAIGEHEQVVSAAQQAVTSAEAHLSTLNGEYAELQRNPSANPAGYSVRMGELENEISDAAAALRMAQEDVPHIERETRESIAQAQAAVQEAERPIARARETFDAAAAAADRARDAYATAKEDAEKRQKELRGKISEGERASKAQERAAQESQVEADDAQATLDEAADIHAHPEATSALAKALEADRAECARWALEVEQLAATEIDVRERTRGARLKLMLAIGACVLVIALALVWMHFAA